MTFEYPLRIMGVGRALPSRVVTATEVEQLCGLSAGWVARRAGVLERRWVNTETAVTMGAEAAREAVANAGIAFTEIDLLLNASGTAHQAIPDGGALLQRELGLGLSGMAAMSVHATCLSFLAALDMAAALIAAERYQTILIISSDIGSVGINFNEAESATLIGDGAGAVVVGRTPRGEGSCMVTARFATYGTGAHLTEIRGGGTAKYPLHPDTVPQDNQFHMEGPEVLRMALKYGGDFLEQMRLGLSKGRAGVKLVIPHQTSLMGLKALELFGWERDCIVQTLHKYGNCVAASLPLTLYEAIQSGRLERGDEFLLVGTGAGLSLGAMILRY